MDERFTGWETRSLILLQIISCPNLLLRSASTSQREPRHNTTHGHAQKFEKYMEYKSIVSDICVTHVSDACLTRDNSTLRVFVLPSLNQIQILIKSRLNQIRVVFRCRILFDLDLVLRISESKVIFDSDRIRYSIHNLCIYYATTHKIAKT